MKIGICSLAIGDTYKSKFNLCINSLNKYCEFNNYSLLNNESDINLVNDRTVQWNKINLILKHLNTEKFDYLVWIDADIMIMNKSIKLEEIIIKYMKNKNFMCCVDSGDQLNTGFLFVKVCDYSKLLFNTMYNFPELNSRFHEQGAFNDFYNKNILNLKNNCIVIPEYNQRLFNSTIYSYHYGDFLIHFLGIIEEKWIKLLTNEYYPYKLDYENEEEYTARFNNVKEKSLNYRYIIPEKYVKICMCTLYKDKDKDIYKLSLNSIQKYCEKNKYIFKSNIIEESENYTKSKYEYINKNLKEDYDYVIWVNPSLLIYNNDIELEHIISKHMNNKNIMISRSTFGYINTSMIYFKKSYYTNNLTYILEQYNEKLLNCEYLNQELNDLYKMNFFDLHLNSVIVSDYEQLFNCCVGNFKYNTFILEFYYFSNNGILKATQDFNPYRNDYETDYMFFQRKLWLKTFH